MHLSFLVNLSWVVTLLALSVTGVALVAGSERAWVLFYDGDSVFPALIVHDLFAGVPLHFVFSYVLFLPELVVYVVVASFQLSTQAAMAIVGVIWLFLIGVGIRCASQWAMPVVQARVGGATGARRRQASTVRLLTSTVGSLIAVAVLLAQISVERSADRDSIEFASLAMTSTYYVSTTFAMILTIGLVARAQTRRESRMRGTVIVVAALATLATWVNPMYIAWSAAPAVLGLVTLVVLRRCAIAGMWRTTVALVVGSLLGMLARVPFASWMGSGLHPPTVLPPTPSGLHAVSQTSAAVASLARLGWWAKEVQFWKLSLATFWDSTWARLGSVGGVIDFAFTILGVLSAVAVTVIAYRTRRQGMLTLGLVVLWTVPVTTAWPLVLATTGTRYWEAIEFAPLLSVAVFAAWLLERFLERRLEGAVSRQRRRLVPAGVARVPVLLCVVVMVASVLLAGGMSLRAARSTADAAGAASVMCVANWVDAHPGEYGAGTYWSIRSAKAYVTDPAHLLQITVHFQSWRWLVNQEDFNQPSVNYLVRSTGDGLDTSELPAVLRSPPTVARCGSFSIQQLPQPLVITAYWGLQQD